MNVSVIGLGRAGLPLAAVIADSGYQVQGVDLSQERVDTVNAGKSPFDDEPGLHELLQKHAGKKLTATSDAVKAAQTSNVHIIIVPLIINEKHECDFRAIDGACANIAKGLKKGDLVVLETTVPPKTTETHVKELLEKSGLTAGKDFFLANSPERIMAGQCIERLRNFPKVVGGINSESTDKAYEFYKSFAKIQKVRDARTAELVKVFEGVYRDVNIGLANQLYQVADQFGVDFWEIRAFARHQFCNILEPGAVGGHCIPVYPWFLINTADVPLIKSARQVNEHVLEFFASKVKERIGNKGNVGVVGLSFRDGVKDLHFSQSIPFIKLLGKKGYNVYAIDGHIPKEDIERAGLKYLDDFDAMDCIVLMNKTKQFADKLEHKKEKVLDIKNSLGKEA